MAADRRRLRARRGFATRLLVAQTLVLLSGASTSWLVAAALGPSIFRDHLDQAGLSHTPSETAHVEEAFSSAMLFALVIALLVSLVIALAVTWLFTHRLQRSIDEVAASTEQMATGDYRARAARTGLGAEFDLLTGAINELAERLEAVEGSRRHMLSDLAHEMRTPLATIEAHLEAIEDGVRSADAETITVLRSSTDRLARLAQDINAVSKAEEGQLRIDLQLLSAADLVHDAVAAAGAAACAKGVDLRADVESASVQVMADPERIGQVLGNLLDNAIRHSPPSSAIVVSCRKADRRWVELTVADSGDGIDAEHLNHVFDRFYRADTARNRDLGGSGIGLTISRALVEAHGGHISAGSAGAGHGATFQVRLPVAG